MKKSMSCFGCFSDVTLILISRNSDSGSDDDLDVCVLNVFVIHKYSLTTLWVDSGTKSHSGTANSEQQIPFSVDKGKGRSLVQPLVDDEAEEAEGDTEDDEYLSEHEINTKMLVAAKCV